MNLTSSHDSAGMEDDAFHHATLAGGKEMFQAVGSPGALQGLVCAGMARVQATLLSQPMDENCLWRSISCASRASLAACMMPGSSARAKAVMEWPPSSARPSSGTPCLQGQALPVDPHLHRLFFHSLASQHLQQSQAQPGSR